MNLFIITTNVKKISRFKVEIFSHNFFFLPAFCQKTSNGYFLIAKYQSNFSYKKVWC